MVKIATCWCTSDRLIPNETGKLAKQKMGVNNAPAKESGRRFLLSAILGGEAAAKDITIGFSWNQKESSLETAWEDYLKSEGKAQGEAAGVTIKWIFNVANGDPARQAANIEDLINKGVDIIMARAEDSAAISASIKAAKAANIPFITFDRASAGAKPTAHVGGDSYDQAFVAGAAFAELLKSKGVTGKCIELQGALTDVNAVNRSKGWNEAASKGGITGWLAGGVDGGGVVLMWA